MSSEHSALSHILIRIETQIPHTDTDPYPDPQPESEPIQIQITSQISDPDPDPPPALDPYHQDQDPPVIAPPARIFVCVQAA